MLVGLGRILGVECLLAEEESGDAVLAGDGSFAAFPWMETARKDEIERFLGAVEEVVERGEGDGGVITLLDLFAVGFEEFEAVFERVVEFLAELILFGNEAGVRGVLFDGC